MAVCPEVCDAQLNLTASFGFVDRTFALDGKCNETMFMTDDKGLADVDDPASLPFLGLNRRTHLFASLPEVGDYYGVSSETYKAAQQYFQQTGRNVKGYFTVGCWERGVESLPSALDAISACQNCWTHLAFAHFAVDGTQLIDDAQMLLAAEWAEANCKMAHFLSIDDGHEDASDSGTLTAQMADLGLKHSEVHYTQGQCSIIRDLETGEPILDADGEEQIQTTYPHLEFFYAGWMANRDLTQPRQAYTMALKPTGCVGWAGVSPDNFSQGVVSAATGVLPNGFLNPNNAGYANVFVRNKGGCPGVWNGRQVTGHLSDHLHLSICIKNEICAAIARALASEDCIPYDSRGQTIQANVVESILMRYSRFGYFNQDVLEEFSQPYVRRGRGYVIRQAEFSDQPETRRFARVSPAMEACWVPAGCTHFMPMVLCAEAVPQPQFTTEAV